MLCVVVPDGKLIVPDAEVKSNPAAAEIADVLYDIEIKLLELAESVTVNVAFPEASLIERSVMAALTKVARYAFNVFNKPEVAALPETVPGIGLMESVCPLNVNPIYLLDEIGYVDDPLLPFVATDVTVAELGRKTMVVTVPLGALHFTKPGID